MPHEVVILPALRRPSAAEEQLLLCCARTVLDPRTRARLTELLSGDLDWDYLQDAAKLHAVMPLMYRHLSSLDDLVPPAVIERLRADYRANAQRNLALSVDLVNLLRLFEGAGIPALPLKGPVLTASVYGDLSLRQFGDLDILFHERDIARARDVLATNGFLPAMEMSPSQEAATLRHHCEYLMLSESGRTLVELHWRIIPAWFPFPLGGEQLLPRLEQTSLAGSTVPTVSAEDMLLVICVHSTKHMWTKLGWACDVAEVVRANPALDWNLLLGRARQLGGERMLLLGLLLAHDLLGAPLPDSVLERADREPIRSLARQSRALLFRDRPEAAMGFGWPGYFEASRYYIAAMERRRDKLRYCFRFLTTPMEEDWDNLKLPERLFPLYYVLRPFRVGRWLPRWMWHRLRGTAAAG